MMDEYIVPECGDCLHAELCERMPNLIGFNRENPAYCKGFKSAADVVEVRHGEWVDDCGKRVPFDEKDGCPKHSCYCSECGKWLTASDEYPCYGNYCPNCGADMRGEKNEKV